VYPATIVGIPPMEDFYIGGASVKLFLPIFAVGHQLPAPSGAKSL
jgi:3-polyprenyl-4-hydroxybenzoate decarboxylase